MNKIINLTLPGASSGRGDGKPVARKRLAIVSTYDELCGIAGYTRALQRQLAGSFDVTVMDLDQYLLRSPHKKVQKLADAHVRDIARQLAGFDFVNIQLEHGTLGTSTAQVIRRFGRLARAAKGLSVSFHTVFPAEMIDGAELWRRLRRLRIGAAIDLIGAYRRSTLLSRGIYSTLRKLARIKPVRAIVHNKRDMRLLRDVFGVKHVEHHPLSYVLPAERALVRATAGRGDFPLLRSLDAGAKLVGVFGFLSEYKGFDTAIRALRLLPDDYHLLLFGGIHPQTIRKRTPIDPYLQKLLDVAYIDRTVFDEFSGSPSGSASVQIALDGNATSLLEGHPKSLRGRLHFMGALGDAEFLGAMTVCDAVVFSYLEVGQSSSGPIAQALEMGCRVIASRTATFMQYARYHPDRFEFFDIGNHLELAERIAAPSPTDCLARQLDYNYLTNTALYERANSPAGASFAAAGTHAGPVPAVP